MIKVIPAEVHLLGLLHHPDRLDDEAVRGVMEHHHHYCPPARELQERRRHHVPPVGFDPYNRRHHSSMEWLRRNRAYLLFHPDSTMEQAFEILTVPPVRLLLEVLLIMRAHIPSIAKALQAQYGFGCTAMTVLKYRHFFFDVQRLDQLDLLQVLLLSDSNWQLGVDRDVTAMHIAAEQYASGRDPRRLVAENPTSATAINAALRLCGCPQQSATTQLAVSVSECAVRVGERMCEEAGSRSPRFANNLNQLASTLKTLVDVGNGLHSPDDPIKQEFMSKLRMEADTSILPTVHQLTAGAGRTIDVQPMPKTETFDVREAEHAEGLFGGATTLEDLGEDGLSDEGDPDVTDRQD